MNSTGAVVVINFNLMSMAGRRLNERLAKYNYLYDDDVISTSDKQSTADSYSGEANGSSTPGPRNEHRSAVNEINLTTNNNHHESPRVTRNGERCVNSELTAGRSPTSSTSSSSYSSVAGPRGPLLHTVSTSARSQPTLTNSDHTPDHRSVSLIVDRLIK